MPDPKPPLWVIASGAPVSLDLPTGQKFELGAVAKKFTGDEAAFIRRALKHSQGVRKASEQEIALASAPVIASEAKQSTPDQTATSPSAPRGDSPVTVPSPVGEGGAAAPDEGSDKPGKAGKKGA